MFPITNSEKQNNNNNNKTLLMVMTINAIHSSASTSGMSLERKRPPTNSRRWRWPDLMSMAPDYGEATN
jgi:cytochrome oxidase assembly protein ShyY1